MKKIAIVICCIMFAVALISGCDNPEAKTGEATAFGLVGGCPASAKVKTDGDGKILEVEINEFLSVYDMGKLTIKDGKDKRNAGRVRKECTSGRAAFCLRRR